LVTIVFNVPLNNGLAAVDPTSADAVQIWTNYVKSWTAWNHVRTAAALVAAVLFTVALCHASSPFESVGSQMSSPATSTILSDKPEDWQRVFEQYLNAGDLDSVMALYESEARFVMKSGETLAGHDRIRKALVGMIRSKTKLQSRVLKTITVGDIAQLSQLYTDFEGTKIGDSGNTVPVRNKAIEVLRRQPDGSWKLITGDPNGRK
jgi:ketosteroid isomerase-like protein